MRAGEGARRIHPASSALTPGDQIWVTRYLGVFKHQRNLCDGPLSVRWRTACRREPEHDKQHVFAYLTSRRYESTLDSRCHLPGLRICRRTWDWSMASQLWVVSERLRNRGSRRAGGLVGYWSIVTTGRYLLGPSQAVPSPQRDGRQQVESRDTFMPVNNRLEAAIPRSRRQCRSMALSTITNEIMGPDSTLCRFADSVIDLHA